jgi:hypothetical protein
MSLARDWADLEAWRDINRFPSSPMLVTIGGYFAGGAYRRRLA